MTMVSINTNVGAIFAAHSSYKVNKSMETSMARLSSGKRITELQMSGHSDCNSNGY